MVFARNLGHTIVQTTPALVPLLLEERDRFSINRELSGVSQDVELAVWVDGRVSTRLKGSLLWTHFGISGPVALNASRHWLRAEVEKRPVRLTVNFCAGIAFAAQEEWWTSTTAARPKASVMSVLSTRVPAAVAAAVIRSVNVDPTSARPSYVRRTEDAHDRVGRMAVGRDRCLWLELRRTHGRRRHAR